ncbi:MAG TPA: Hpt domain-containing protein, partial [Oligoflexia bacterium]|nr:Hpt domain-containing protein [Oligoflexia bacterium]
MADQEILQAFIVESLDLLDSLEPKLIELQQACEKTGAADNDLINAIFRPFHSMKGGAGMLELNNITSLTHTAETLLDMIR